MKTVVIGLGTQGKKRTTSVGGDLAATVDPINLDAQYTSINQVPLDSFDSAMVCTPEDAKLDILDYLLSHGKHVLVEKPLLADRQDRFRSLSEFARAKGVACYTAYNHRFEPHIKDLKVLLDNGILGKTYRASFYYGNGTARNIKESTWRDQGLGVISDLGSHLIDLSDFLFGRSRSEFTTWQAHRFETKAWDHALFGRDGEPALYMEVSFLSWRNTFTVEVIGELGSAHINGLCKWGKSTLTVRKRMFPSGVPEEQVKTIDGRDRTWDLEYEHFKYLSTMGATDLEKDQWINFVLGSLAESVVSEANR